MSVEDFLKDPLWPVLVDTVHSVVMFPSHKAYMREVILPEKPEITPLELAGRLRMSLGEACVILYELAQERSPPQPR